MMSMNLRLMMNSFKLMIGLDYQIVIKVSAMAL